MSEAKIAGGIVLPPGVDVPGLQPADGSCPDCRASNEKFEPNLGGNETCMQCGHQREANG